MDILQGFYKPKYFFCRNKMEIVSQKLNNFVILPDLICHPINVLFIVRTAFQL